MPVFGFECAGGCTGNIYIFFFFFIVSVVTFSWTQKFANLPDFIFDAILPAMAQRKAVCMSVYVRVIR